MNSYQKFKWILNKNIKLIERKALKGTHLPMVIKEYKEDIQPLPIIRTYICM